MPEIFWSWNVSNNRPQFFLNPYRLGAFATHRFMHCRTPCGCPFLEVSSARGTRFCSPCDFTRLIFLCWTARCCFLPILVRLVLSPMPAPNIRCGNGYSQMWAPSDTGRQRPARVDRFTWHAGRKRGESRPRTPQTACNHRRADPGGSEEIVDPFKSFYRCFGNSRTFNEASYRPSPGWRVKPKREQKRCMRTLSGWIHPWIDSIPSFRATRMSARIRMVPMP